MLTLALMGLEEVWLSLNQLLKLQTQLRLMQLPKPLIGTV